MKLSRLFRTALLLLLCAVPIMLWAGLSFSPQRRVAVLSDPYWQRLFWDDHQSRLQTALLNAGSRAEFTPVSMTEVPVKTGEEALPYRILDYPPRVLILSPRLSPLAGTAAARLPETRIITWSADGEWRPADNSADNPADNNEPENDEAGGVEAPRSGEEQPENVTLLYPDLRNAFYRAGKAEAQALLSSAPPIAAGKDDTPDADRRQSGEADAKRGRVVHMYRPGGLAGEKEMDALRRGLQDGGWQGKVETLRWTEEEQTEFPETLSSAGEAGGDSRKAPVMFLGVYTGVSASRVLEAAREHGTAAAVLGPEMRKAYPETVQFSLELQVYPTLRRISTEAVRGSSVPRRASIEGTIVWR